jgi:Zn-dependent peptidase ImmA (M78 family)
MAKSPRALVDPALLLWARKTARVTTKDVAARLKLSEARVEAWESGLDSPSIAQLRKLADAYRRPVAVFFLPEPPRDFEALHDFRRVTQEAIEVSKELEENLRRAQELREAGLTLLEDPGEAAAFPLAISIQDDPENVGDLIRQALKVADDAQLGWKDSYTALRAWRLAVESLGVLVVNMKGVKLSEARGFSIAESPLPLIAINAKDSANGRLFTLMHEVAHLALHEGGICDWTPEQRLITANRRVETFCNRVAAAILLPRRLVLQVVRGDVLPPSNDWPDEILKRYARVLAVSEEALLRRLVSLGLATPELYAARRIGYLERYAEAAKKETKAVVSFEKRVVGRLGTAYLDLAFNAYYSRRLTLSELSSYTGVRVAHLSKVEREAFGMTRVPGSIA